MATKPTSIARMDFIKNLNDTINNSELPVFMINDILVNLLSEIGKLTDEQVKNDAKQYQEELAKEEEEKSKESLKAQEVIDN